MAAPDPSAGTTFIWFISAVLFLSIATGGGCLVLYIAKPESHHASWLPFAGVALVCLPWLFWILTCVYRVVSRACGLRVGVESGGGGGEGDGGGGGGRGGGALEGGSVADVGRADVVNAAVVEATVPANVETRVRSSESDARRRAQFEAILELDEEDGHGGPEGDDKKKSNYTSTRSNSNSSLASHESEMPLASSMVT